MAEFDYFMERNAAQKINERVEQTRRNRIAGRRHSRRPGNARRRSR